MLTQLAPRGLGPGLMRARMAQSREDFKAKRRALTNLRTRLGQLLLLSHLGMSVLLCCSEFWCHEQESQIWAVDSTVDSDMIWSMIV